MRKMKIDASEVPSSPLIPESGHIFYKMAVNPVNNDIVVTDAVDYQQKGHLLRYNSKGSSEDDELADIIPGMLIFSLNPDFN